MRRIISIIFTTAVLTACSGESPRIVSDQPVDNVVMGAVLCEPVSEASVMSAFDKAGIIDVKAQKYSHASGSGLMIVPSADDGIMFAGCCWDYADFCKEASGNLYAVVFENFYDTRSQAEDQYKKVAGLIGAKHGEANSLRSKGARTSMWTDDTNSVGISIHKNGNEDARGKWACTFYYVNIALSKTL